MIWKINTFDELDTDSLYKILRLRAEVFVLEQNCCYLDVDGKDKYAIHLHGYVENQLATYCRLFKKGDYFDQASIGRVVTSPQHRGKGYGNQLIKKAIELQKTLFNENEITISGQLYLKKFYESHGFVKTSDEYLEDNIPHIQMKYNR